jgi:hypothetical protein
MNYKSKEKRTASDGKLASGIEKYLSKATPIVLNGRKVSVKEMLAMLAQRAEAARLSEAGRGEWLAIVEKERTLVDETQPFVEALRAYLVAMFGKNPSALAECGIVIAKPRALSSEELAARTKKARDTLKARRAANAAPAATAPTAAPSAPAPAGGG